MTISHNVQKEMVVKIKKAIWIGVALSLLGLVSASSARADERNKQTVLTFTQPVEIPGRVLPAGTYVFRLVDSMTDRHIVGIYTADGTKIIATVMAIPRERIKATDDTVIRFREVPAGAPEAIRAWFYPGNLLGQEFVYPKARAVQLAKASKGVVPAIAVDVTSADDLKTAPIIGVAPDETEVPLAAAIPATPLPTSSSAVVHETDSQAKELPKTGSDLPLIALFGFAAIGLAFGLMAFGKRSSASAR